MHVFFLVLNKTGVVDELLKEFVNINVRGATIIDSMGMGRALMKSDMDEIPIPVSYTHLDVYKRQLSFIAEIGAQGKRTTTMADNQRALTDQINAQRQSVMGVNIDEEMMDIIKFQQAFNAMARYITTIDEMLDTIINRMGMVGR